MNKPTDLTPKQAYDKLQGKEKVLFLDIRTPSEYYLVGHPLHAILLPWLEDPDWRENPDFTKSVAQLMAEHNLSPDSEIILICRSGRRTLDAGRALMRNGFKNVAHVASGFEGDLDHHKQRGNINGWRHDGLPWKQS